MIENFHIHHKIGAGTFGTVYSASLKHNLDKRFALKHINSGCLPNKIEKGITFMHLMKDCEHIISLETFICHNDQVVLVMPFFEHDIFKDYFNTMAINEVKQYIRALFMALEVVHDHHIIHRDIKPSNFLYNCKNKTFKLIDFGMAHYEIGYDSPSTCILPVNPSVSLVKKMKHCSLSHNKTLACNHKVSETCNACNSKPSQRSPWAGTSGFRAPEVLLKYQYQTTAIDIWSAGIIFLCLLSGKYPFFKANDDMTAMIQISTLLGSQQCINAAKCIGKDLYFSTSHHAQNLAENCIQLKHTESSGKGCKEHNTIDLLHHIKDCTCTSKKMWTSAPSEAYDLLQKCL